ncbi:MAG: hypothetical protein FRX49_02717 [Trebouxia sp. A1-2]|nr:MAG: hypothetical protein FRX49_02717 [Trebouxia sp. A1-2]
MRAQQQAQVCTWEHRGWRCGGEQKLTRVTGSRLYWMLLMAVGLKVPSPTSGPSIRVALVNKRTSSSPSPVTDDVKKTGARLSVCMCLAQGLECKGTHMDISGGLQQATYTQVVLSNG